MENYEKHFQETEVVKFKIKDGTEFGYKPMTAGEENDYMKEYMITEKFVGEDGKQCSRKVEDITKINKVKTYNLVETPYLDWNKKNKEQKWLMLRSLKPTIFSEIINNINSIDTGDTQDKKNL